MKHLAVVVVTDLNRIGGCMSFHCRSLCHVLTVSVSVHGFGNHCPKPPPKLLVFGVFKVYRVCHFVITFHMTIMLCCGPISAVGLTWDSTTHSCCHLSLTTKIWLIPSLCFIQDSMLMRSNYFPLYKVSRLGCLLLLPDVKHVIWYQTATFRLSKGLMAFICQELWTICGQIPVLVCVTIHL